VEKRGSKKYITERMEEAPEYGKESSHSVHANGMNEYHPPQLNSKKAMK